MCNYKTNITNVIRGNRIENIRNKRILFVLTIAI